MSKRDSKRAESGSPDYRVGYGRPPVEHQFKPGQPGNPNGRPRKDKGQQETGARWGVSRHAAGRVLYEEVTVTQNGKTVKMPMIEAVHRRRAADALKGGNRLLQREVIAEANAHEQQLLEAEVRHFCELRDQKVEGEQLLTQARSRGLPEPELLPHPDDIQVDDYQLTAWVDGPTTAEELAVQKFLRQLRDFTVLRSVYQQRFPSLIYPVDPKGHEWLQPVGEMLNDRLCPRLRWGRSGLWHASQPLMRRGFRFMEADMEEGLWSLEQTWKREPALTPLRQIKLLHRLLTDLLGFKTRSHERRIWQRQHEVLLAVFREAYGPEKVAHMPKRASLRPYAERNAALEALSEDERRLLKRRTTVLTEAGFRLPYV
jgi:Family of unknown function (DUF5681)